MKERLLKYGGVVGYPLFFVVCLMLFGSLTFPYDKLKERIVASFNLQAHPGSSQQELQIDDLGGYWVSGVRMKGVRLLTASAEPGKAPSKIEIDEATVRYSILPLLVGSSDMNFDFVAFSGEISGSYDAPGKDKSVDLSIESVDIGKITPLVQVLGVPLEGKLGGTVRFMMPDGKASKASGAVSLEAKDVAVGDGKAKDQRHDRAAEGGCWRDHVRCRRKGRRAQDHEARRRGQGRRSAGRRAHHDARARDGLALRRPAALQDQRRIPG